MLAIDNQFLMMMGVRLNRTGKIFCITVAFSLVLSTVSCWVKSMSEALTEIPSCHLSHNVVILNKLPPNNYYLLTIVGDNLPNWWLVGITVQKNSSSQILYRYEPFYRRSFEESGQFHGMDEITLGSFFVDDAVGDITVNLPEELVDEHDFILRVLPPARDSISFYELQYIADWVYICCMYILLTSLILILGNCLFSWIYSNLD